MAILRCSLPSRPVRIAMLCSDGAQGELDKASSRSPRCSERRMHHSQWMQGAAARLAGTEITPAGAAAATLTPDYQPFIHGGMLHVLILCSGTRSITCMCCQKHCRGVAELIASAYAVMAAHAGGGSGGRARVQEAKLRSWMEGEGGGVLSEHLS